MRIFGPRDGCWALCSSSVFRLPGTYALTLNTYERLPAFSGGRRRAAFPRCCAIPSTSTNVSYVFSVRSAQTNCWKIQRAGNATGLRPYPPFGGAACPYLAANILRRAGTTPTLRSTVVFASRRSAGDVDNVPVHRQRRPAGGIRQMNTAPYTYGARRRMRMGAVGAGCPAGGRIGPAAGPWHCLPSGVLLGSSA